MSKKKPEQWKIQPIDYGAVQKLAKQMHMNTLFTTVLVNRGARTVWDAKNYLEPKLENLHDSYLIAHMREAVDRIAKAIEKGETILIFGDSDVDGVTSTSLLYQYLLTCGADAHYFIPRRHEDGHGFNDATISAGLSRVMPQLFIAVDCGMTGVAEIDHLNAQGIDCMIVDHHAPGEQSPAAIILNPKLEYSEFPFRDLAAVGVVFHFVEAIHRHFLQSQWYEDKGITPPHLIDYLDLVCLGTIADVVPLVDENRSFVSLGLDVIRKRRRSGIAALLADISVDSEDITERTICFRLAPRINAAGRMGDPNESVALLSTYRYTTAQGLAKKLESYNTQRQNAEAAILHEALAEAQVQVDAGEKIIIVAKEGWTQGILGILSSRLLDRFYRPSVVISIHKGECRGSARSIKSFSILNCFKHCEEYLDDYGGHHVAAGLNLREDNLKPFIEKAQKYARAHISSERELHSISQVDAHVHIEELRKDWSKEHLEMLAPFGSSNAEPVFLVAPVKVVQIKRINRRLLRIKLKQDSAYLTIVAPIEFSPQLKLNSFIQAILTPKLSPNKAHNSFMLLAIEEANNRDV